MTASAADLPGDALSANPYRLDVLTPNVAEVLAEAGGWIIDRALAGWTVTVIVTGPVVPSEDRLGKIMGVEITGREALTDTTRFSPYGIGLTAGLHGTDDVAHDYLAAALTHQCIEISIFGDGPITLTDGEFQAVTHRVSAAARAFKAHSLAAAGLPGGSAQAVEHFRSAILPRAGAANRALGGPTRTGLGPGQVVGLPRQTFAESRKLVAFPGSHLGQ